MWLFYVGTSEYKKCVCSDSSYDSNVKVIMSEMLKGYSASGNDNKTEQKIIPMWASNHLPSAIGGRGPGHFEKAKEIFRILSFKFNLFITRDSFYNSKFLSFLCLTITMRNFKCSWLWRQNVREKVLPIFLRVCIERKKMSGLKRLNIESTTFTVRQTIGKWWVLFHGWSTRFLLILQA
jgi:hypothetical protein